MSGDVSPVVRNHGDPIPDAMPQPLLAELDELADELRRATVRLRFERMAITAQADILAWVMLQESERVQWRDIASAVREVLG